MALRWQVRKGTGDWAWAGTEETVQIITRRPGVNPSFVSCWLILGKEPGLNGPQFLHL